MKAQTLRADALMMLAAVLWGGAFVAQRAAMQQGMGPLSYNGVRFTIGAVTLVPVALFMSRRRRNGSNGSAADHVPWRLYLPGVLAGLVLALAVNLQQAGMVYTTAAKAGFITGLYMPLVAVLGIFVGERTSLATWCGAGIAVIGLYWLSIQGKFEISPGDGLVMMCAVVWACHVLLIGKLSPRTDPIVFAIVQFATTAAVSLPIGLCREPFTLPMLQTCAIAIAYGSIASVAIAYTLQIVGQRHAPPAHAALVLSLETVFAGLTGYLILHERFGGRELLGAALMFTGMLVSQAHRFLPGRAEKPAAAATEPEPV